MNKNHLNIKIFINLFTKYNKFKCQKIRIDERFPLIQVCKRNMGSRSYPLDIHVTSADSGVLGLSMFTRDDGN